VSNAPEQRQENVEGTEGTEEHAPAARHVDTRTLVFPDLKVMYVPVPKAACTAIMWALAELSGLDQDLFYSSFGFEVSRSLTIHDLSNWPDRFLYMKLSEEEKEEILAAPDWFRFTVVRHPFRRLWSAWQSKVLLGEPQFIGKFSSSEWFPTSAGSASDVLKSFRQFLEALEQDEALVQADVHWAPQVEVVSLHEMHYTHVGRVENMNATADALRAHVRDIVGSSLPDLQRENVTPLPYVDQLFDTADVRVLCERFADDLKEFDYQVPADEALDASCPDEWIATVDAVAPALEALRQRHARMLDLHVAFKDNRRDLNERINEIRNRVRQQKTRIEQQQRRLKQQAKLRAEERRRNERLQQRLRETTRDLERIRNSKTWRYTAPLRRLSRLGRKPFRRRRTTDR
jgi:hypothetical protein